MHEIIEKTTEMISRNPNILKTLSSHHFRVTIEIADEIYTMIMNRSSKYPLKWKKGGDQKSDLTAKLLEKSYQAIINDEMSWIDAYIFGELTFDNDPTPFMDAARILELARPLYTKHINIASNRNEMENELEAKLNNE